MYELIADIQRMEAECDLLQIEALSGATNPNEVFATIMAKRSSIGVLRNTLTSKVTMQLVCR
ncbi:MAG TPA: hypothetical protein VGN12_16930 [Pirellulales bacterium]|jgi:hypothetical protein